MIQNSHLGCLFAIVALLYPLVGAAQELDCGCSAPDLMDTRNFQLRDFRRMFQNGTTPTEQDLWGTWRGVNKGIVTLVGYKQFIKEIQPNENGCLFGDNIKVQQVPKGCVRCIGWQPKLDESGFLHRHDRFMIQPENGRGQFGHGKIFSYRDGGNRRFAPSRLIVDKVVKLDDDHLLGRATLRTVFGPVPVAYFMLERIRQEVDLSAIGTVRNRQSRCLVVMRLRRKN